MYTDELLYEHKLCARALRRMMRSPNPFRGGSSDGEEEDAFARVLGAAVVRAEKQASPL